MASAFVEFTSDRLIVWSQGWHSQPSVFFTPCWGQQGKAQLWIQHWMISWILGTSSSAEQFFTSFEDLENNLVLIQKPVVASSMACEGSWSYLPSVPIVHEDTKSALAWASSQLSVPTRALAVSADVLMDVVRASVWATWAHLPSTLNWCSCYFSLVYWGLICWTAPVSLQTEVGCWPGLKSSLKT